MLLVLMHFGNLFTLFAFSVNSLFGLFFTFSATRFAFSAHAFNSNQLLPHCIVKISTKSVDSFLLLIEKKHCLKPQTRRRVVPLFPLAYVLKRNKYNILILSSNLFIEILAKKR